jgi:hypothetical protein
MSMPGLNVQTIANAAARSRPADARHAAAKSVPDKGAPGLSALAMAAAAEPTVAAWSPIVVAGIVRMSEFVLIAAIGLAIYVGYVVPAEGFEWRYVGTVLAIAMMAMLAFQTADIYQVQAFRGYEKQYFRLASAWSVVFLLVISMSFFLKIGDQYSRLWLGSFYVAGLVVLVAFRRSLFVMVRHWTREGRLDRRTAIVGADERGDALLRTLAAQRDSDVRVIGVFDDRSEERAPGAAGRLQKLGSVDDLVNFARTTRIDLVIFALPVSAEGRASPAGRRSAAGAGRPIRRRRSSGGSSTTSTTSRTGRCCSISSFSRRRRSRLREPRTLSDGSSRMTFLRIVILRYLFV